MLNYALNNIKLGQGQFIVSIKRDLLCEFPVMYFYSESLLE